MREKIGDEKPMRVALIHYWLMGSRGGEKVLEAICRIFPEADIFTLFYEPDSVSSLIRSKKVTASFLNPARRFYRSLLPLMPVALESFDLRSYDLVISSESGPAKGVITSAATRHLCYCHTPMRYLWELYPAYLAEFRRGLIGPALLAPLANYLRTWDYTTAARVDGFMANSQNIQHRIWRTYRRKSTVVYPPVPVQSFRHTSLAEHFLIVSEMVPYKRLDYVIRLFAKNGRKLKVVGDGPEYKTLKRLASKNIEFCGRTPEHELRDLYATSAALIMPGEEDFGMTMVESLASGKPVIALACGGAMEIVTTGCGVLYEKPSEASLDEALRSFDRVSHLFDSSHISHRALEFSETAFERRFQKFLNRYGVSSIPMDVSYTEPDLVPEVSGARTGGRPVAKNRFRSFTEIEGPWRV